MADLVKIKGLKGKQNKKKWAKNIDVSELLQAKAKQDTLQLQAQFKTNIEVVDDQAGRIPLNPNRFKNVKMPLPKPKYDNRIVRNLALDQVDDTWSTTFEGRHKYKPTEVPSIIAPESGHSYNPRESDLEKLYDRVVDYEQILPNARKVKATTELPVVEVRSRNKNRRADQLAARTRAEQKEINRELNTLKKINTDIEEKGERIEKGIKTKLIAKEKVRAQRLTGRVRKGPKLSKRPYRFKEYLPEEGSKQVSKVELKQELFRDRFDAIYRRGVFEPRNVKVHANRRKNMKITERAFIE